MTEVQKNTRIKLGRRVFTFGEIESIKEEAPGLVKIMKEYKALNKQFMLYDYYVICGIKTEVKQLTLYCIHQPLLQNDEIQLIREFYNRYVRRIEPVCQRFIDTEKWIVDGREVTTEERQMVWAYMLRNNLPKYLQLYREIGRMYVKGECDIKDSL
jgi:hypothetical protein